jgi:Phospholipase_D-nuclease N-terminal
LNPVFVVILVVALVAGFEVFCLVDLARAQEVRYLPKWGWAILCLGIGLTIPFGGIAYLLFGKIRRPAPPRKPRLG